jgi:hypothetical protein
MRPVRDEYASFRVEAPVLQHLEFFEKIFRIDHHPRAKYHHLVRVKDARGNQVQSVFFITSNNGMSGVGPAGKTDYYLGVFGKVINNLAFSFIAPLGANYNYFHKLSTGILLIIA